MGCCKVKKSDFGFRFQENSVFANSQWKFIPPFIFCIYRIILGLYFLGWLLYSMTASIINNGGAYFLYLTNWGFMTLTLYLVTASSTTLYFHIRTRKTETGLASWSKPNSTPWYFMLSWLLFNLSAIVAPIITLIYWVSLYEGAGLEVGDFHVHAVNFIAVVLEVVIAGMPVRYVHVIYPAIYGITYLSHSLIYWGISGNAIYPILDYSENPGIATATAFGCLAMIIFFQFLLWATYFVKNKLAPQRSRSVDDVTVIANNNEPSKTVLGIDNPTMVMSDKTTQADIEEGEVKNET
ncbi:protein rolling stone-like [Glandiceps talaboti]